MIEAWFETQLATAPEALRAPGAIWVRPANRWVAVKAAGGLDAEVAAELKKMEADAQKKLEEKKKQMEASLNK